MHRADTTRLALLVSALTLATTAGCHLDDEPVLNLEPSASARVRVALPRPLSATVTRVEASIAPTLGDSVSEDLSGEGTQWSGHLDGVTSGEGMMVEARAFDAQGAVVAEVQLSKVRMPRHRTGLLVLVPGVPSQGAPASNVAPFIDAVLASAPSVRPGASLQLSAIAHDLNPDDTLTYAWRATATEGGFADDAVAETLWTAPAEPGEVVLTLQVTDARGAAATLDFAVRVGGLGAQAVERPRCSTVARAGGGGGAALAGGERGQSGGAPGGGRGRGRGRAGVCVDDHVRGHLQRRGGAPGELHARCPAGGGLQLPAVRDGAR